MSTPALRMPTVWLNRPLEPTATSSRGDTACPVTPIWRLRGTQPWSVTLRVAPRAASPSAARSSSIIG